jgi:hypothetical protein
MPSPASGAEIDVLLASAAPLLEPRRDLPEFQNHPAGTCGPGPLTGYEGTSGFVTSDAPIWELDTNTSVTGAVWANALNCRKPSAPERAGDMRILGPGRASRDADPLPGPLPTVSADVESRPPSSVRYLRECCLSLLLDVDRLWVSDGSAADGAWWLILG